MSTNFTYLEFLQWLFWSIGGYKYSINQPILVFLPNLIAEATHLEREKEPLPNEVLETWNSLD
jgi:hypothetical protein